MKNSKSKPTVPKFARFSARQLNLPSGARFGYNFSLFQFLFLVLNKNNFPWLQEYYPWVAEANDNFSTIQKTEGCLAKHLYNETYRIEDV